MSDAGRSPAKDALLFPSDEQLSQRILWICTLIAAGWTVLALAGFLPLYMVNTPCLAHSIPQPRFTGVYSVLQDLSLLRLLHLLDAGQVTTTTLSVALFPREIVDGTDEAPKARLRIIIATVLAIVLGLLPVLWKVLKEFNRTVAYRERWMEVRCQGFEMGWLSARRAPGFVGWGEKRLKDHLVKMGLSSCLDAADRNARSRRRRRAQELNNEEQSNFEIDVQSLFSIGCVFDQTGCFASAHVRVLVILGTLRSSLTSGTRSWRTSRLQRLSTSKASALKLPIRLYLTGSRPYPHRRRSLRAHLGPPSVGPFRSPAPQYVPCL